MKVVCVGAGPAGLFAALFLQAQGHQVCLLERDLPGEHGFGLVLSSQALAEWQQFDPPSAAQAAPALWHLSKVEIRRHNQAEPTPHRTSVAGPGLYAIARSSLLAGLRQAALQAGVLLREACEVQHLQQISQYLPNDFEAELVLACDGVHSRLRSEFAAGFMPTWQVGDCRYLWLACEHHFPAFTFTLVQTAHGPMMAHCYAYQAEQSSVIIEMPEAVWQRAGLAQMNLQQALTACALWFAADLQGAALRAGPTLPAETPGAQCWRKFLVLDCARRVQSVCLDGRILPLVLLGDAAHTLHFSIGAGTRLALLDAQALAYALRNNPQLEQGLAEYEQQSRLSLVRLRAAAQHSMQWFEDLEAHQALAFPQYAYALLTRSQRVTHAQLRQHDATWLADFENWFAAQAQQQNPPQQTAPMPTVPPMFLPLRLRDLCLPNRIVVSPMAQYQAQDGLVADFHLAHLGARALGGAGLVMTEMLAISPQARITPVCAGIYDTKQMQAWRRVVEFVHLHSPAKIGAQLGHAGAKGACHPPWLGQDIPLQEAWPLLAASRMQYVAGVSAWANAATSAQLQSILEEFVSAARLADEAGFDLLELHCAHGYLLSGFLSPLTNQREDEFGGSLLARCRFPAHVVRAVRAVWPQGKPLSVRISVVDWVPGGNTLADGAAIARELVAAGADLVCCSSGQVSRAEQIAYGRMYQVPFAAHLRQKLGVPVIAVGGIEDGAQANMILAAGRADLCAIGRPHLANPAWTLQQAAAQAYHAQAWPVSYLAGKRQLEKQFA